jgi:hypothetical protein
MFWMPVFTGMTMLTVSLRLRHSLLAEVPRFIGAEVERARFKKAEYNSFIAGIISVQAINVKLCYLVRRLGEPAVLWQREKRPNFFKLLV